MHQHEAPRQPVSVLNLAEDPLGDERFALELETTFDRRDFGFDWQMELPSGGDVLDWDVTLNVHLELVKAGEDA